MFFLSFSRTAAASEWCAVQCIFFRVACSAPPPPQSALCSRWTPLPKPRHPRAHRPAEDFTCTRAAVALPPPGRPSLTITLFRYPKSLWYCLPLRRRRLRLRRQWRRRRHEDPCFPLHESYLHIYKASRAERASGERYVHRMVDLDMLHRAVKGSPRL